MQPKYWFSPSTLQLYLKKLWSLPFVGSFWSEPLKSDLLDCSLRTLLVPLYDQGFILRSQTVIKETNNILKSYFSFLWIFLTQSPGLQLLQHGFLQVEHDTKIPAAQLHSILLTESYLRGKSVFGSSTGWHTQSIYSVFDMYSEKPRLWEKMIPDSMYSRKQILTSIWLQFQGGWLRLQFQFGYSFKEQPCHPVSKTKNISG